MNRHLLAAIAALTLTVATDAQAKGRAQPQPEPQAQQEEAGGVDMSHGILSVYLIPADYYYSSIGYGLGARYEIKLVPQGFLPRHQRIRDDLALDFGADYIHADFGRYITSVNYNPYVYPYYTYTYSDITFNAIIPTVGVLWNVHLTPQLTVYPKIDTGYAIGWWSTGVYGGNPGYTAFFIQGAAGISYSFGNFGLRAELGSGMIKLGAQFKM